MAWADWLRVVALQLAADYPGTPGVFLANHVGAMAQQARVMGATSPADHLAKAQAEVDRQAAYLAALEAEAGPWELGPDADGCDLGGYGGHPSEAAWQAWIPGPDGDEWLN